MSLYQKVIHCNKYARFLPKENRREYWGESVDRYVNFIVSEMYKNLKCTPVEVTKFVEEIRNEIYKMRAMPSMRLFFSAGKAVSKEHQMAFNCKFQSIHSLKSFADLLYSLMCTCGVGCSVEKMYIDQLPPFVNSLSFSDEPIIVEDSREGWAEAFLTFLEDLFSGSVREFDVSLIRKKGERLLSSGGTASGPAPLLELRQFVTDLAFANRGRPVSSVNAFDIVCKVAGCVVAGGLRRSAIITLFDEDDDAMFHVKDPEVLRNNTHRYNSNNTVVATKPETVRKVMEVCKFNGEPGIMFKNNVDKKMAAIGRTLTRGSWGMNPCVTGDTLIMTKDGYREIVNLVDKDVEIWNGEEWSLVKPFSTGENDLLEVEFSNGAVVRCTPYHKWLLKDGQRVEAKHLRIDDKLAKWDMPVVKSGVNYDVDYYSQGFYSGDGNAGLNHSWLYEPKFCCKDRLQGEFFENPNFPQRVTWKHGEMMDKGFVPMNATLGGKLNWLAGLLDSDGNTTDNPNSKQLIISSIDKDFLNKVRLLLGTLGCNAKVCDSRGAGYRTLPDGNGGSKKYYCKRTYRLLINASNTALLVDKGLKCNRLDLSKTDPNRDASRFVYVKLIKKLDYKEETFCLTEPKNNTFIANGVLTGNCGEIILRPNQLCNLVEAVLRPGDSLRIDLKKVRVATIMALIQATLTKYKFVDKELQKNQREDPIIGVSLTGIQDCPQYRDLDGENIKALKDMVDKTVDDNWWKFGLKSRPKACTTVKPSGTVGLLVNASSGIHARYARYYVKRTIIGPESELYHFLADCGVPYLEVPSVNGRIFEFPVEAPEQSRLQDDFTLEDQLKSISNANRNWCDHNTSATVYVRDDEWEKLGDMLIESEDFLSLSFLPLSVSTDSSGFAYLPLEAIDEEDYKRRKEIEDKINWKKITDYYKEEHKISEDDEMQKRDFACSGGACSLT